MPDRSSGQALVIRYPEIPLDSAIGCADRLEKLHWVPGFHRNDKRKVFIRRFNIDK
jgi:hypothetical protein